MILIGRGLDFRLETETDWTQSESRANANENRKGQKLNLQARLCSCQSAERKQCCSAITLNRTRKESEDYSDERETGGGRD